MTGTGGSESVNEQTALLPRFKVGRQSFAQSLVTIIGIGIDMHGHVISHLGHSRLLENQLSPRSTRLVLKLAVLFWGQPTQCLPRRCYIRWRVGGGFFF